MIDVNVTNAIGVINVTNAIGAINAIFMMIKDADVYPLPSSSSW